MTTTAITVEIVVIGYTAFIWIFLFAIFLSDTSFDELVSIASKYKEWATLIALLATALAYQVGWLLDYFTYILFYYCWPGRKIKRKHIEDGQFWEIYNLVCQKGSQSVQLQLQTDLNVIRFTRSGSINFFLISVSSFFVVKSLWLSAFSLAISIGCLLSLKKRLEHYYAKIYTSHKHLKSIE